ncbi:gliding motility-associated C-terminal domain-containing protein [Robertkochia solimangrovi]|uniref:T9SS type B sorting domain-containing protein n=1 Tax=Robertkochia solimangrovi TaxID=2213046 RepID=UPI0013A54A05|nr:gliding motility-associated C-terminal domain-containing protein [Robertkochia solimangrovi]
MRTIFVWLIVLLPVYFTTVSAQTTAIPDSNFEQFLIAEGYDTNGANGNILNSDASAVTELNFTRNDITDLTGLGAFVNLVSLNLADNQFTTVDLSILTKLERFYCRDNQILTTLDLSKNLALRILSISRNAFNNTSYSRPITELDLSANINLVDLLVEKSENLTKVTFPVTSTLKYIDFYNLALQTIDLSQLDGLEDFSIDTNTGSSNLIMPIVKNVLKKVSIQSINVNSFDIIAEYTALESLRLVYTWIGSLKLPATDTFKTLVVVRHSFTTPLSFDLVPNLEHLEIRDTKEVPLEIDITSNLKLRSLILWNNKMNAIDVTQNKALSYLTLTNNNLTELDVTQNSMLTWLNANSNKLTDLDITNCVLLEKLEVRSNQLTGNELIQQYYNIRKNDNGLGRSYWLNLDNNYMSGLVPDFSTLVVPGETSGFVLTFAYNKFEFGDIEDTHLQHLGMRQNGEISSYSYDYASQRKVDEEEDLVMNTGESVILSTTVSGKQNHYKWFKDGVVIPDVPDSPDLELTGLTTCNEGVYHCEITSDLMPFENAERAGYNGQNLLLVRNDITLKINAAALECVSLTYPLNGATAIPTDTDLSWENNTGACGFRISVGTTPGGNDLIDNEDVGMVTTYSPATLFAENTTIYVRITPYDASGDLTGCSEDSFTTVSGLTLPECTSLAIPTSASDVSVSTGLQWNNSTTAEGYYLSVGTTSGGTDLVNHQDVGAVTAYSFDADLPENTMIYVRIIPYNAAGEATGCIEESFTTETLLTIPDCVSLVQPLSGGMNVAVNTGLQWNNSTTAEGYYLSVGTTSGGTDLVNHQDVGAVTAYSFNADLPENTMIYVRIIPYNAAGEATGCIEESFTTETLLTIPDCVSLVQPLSGATDISVNTLFQWTGARNAEGYRIRIGTFSGGADILNDTDVGDHAYYQPSVSLPESTTIYVKIIPYNLAGAAEDCMEVSFTTESLLSIPHCVTLVSPLNGANEVHPNVRLRWSSSMHATGYRLSAGTSSGGTDIVTNEDVGNVTEFTFISQLPEDRRIYINITPYNAAGEAVNCDESYFNTGKVYPDESTKYGISANGDGINDYWKIVGLEMYPHNMVSIYNRWGELVFEIKGYDNDSKVFNGEANRLTGLGGGKLPEGTYFYNITIDEPHNITDLKGFIVLKR